jgi:hypothetical protein
MASWKVIAALLAERVANYAGACPVHAPGDWGEHYRDCPYCADTRAYHAYLKAGGYDYRPSFEGRAVSLEEIMKGKKEE